MACSLDIHQTLPEVCACSCTVAASGLGIYAVRLRLFPALQFLLLSWRSVTVGHIEMCLEQVEVETSADLRRCAAEA